MKKFFLKLFIFLLLVKLSDVLLYSFLGQVISRDISLENDYGSLQRMYSGLINTDIIAIGSSRTYLHINPAVIQQVTGRTAWNLGMDGTGIGQHIFTLEEYLLHNTAPQIVLFEVDLNTINGTSLSFDNKKDLFIPYKNYSQHTADLFNTNADGRDGATLRLYGKLFSSAFYKPEIPKLLKQAGAILSNQRKQLDSNRLALGGIISADTGNILFINGAHLKKGQIQAELPNVLPYPNPQVSYDFPQAALSERGKSFEKMAQLAQDKGFILGLIMMPHLQGELDEGQRLFASAYYTALAQKYQNVRFLDYSADQAISNHLDLWWNSGHLNIDGANLLSEKIGLELTNILKVKK